jgi:hypothetical protein
MRANTALQPTGYSGLRPLSPSAELERYVSNTPIDHSINSGIMFT